MQVDKLERQVGRFVHATNSAFSVVENPQFRAMMDLVRPGLAIPGRRAVGGRILESVYSEEWSKFIEAKKGMFCTLSIDGWSNPKNDPILGIMVDAHLVDTIRHKRKTPYGCLFGGGDGGCHSKN